ncbi:MAG: hypothetical protein DRI95_08325 [Bacteroidetes bacterium]|nr:MAG: hypothetical protein DRI95_08325 [Bacteroidota bacterium]
MEKMKEIILPNSGKKSWMGGAYTLTFVYSKEGNYHLKGYIDEVEEYLKKKKYWFANFTLWSNGEHRSIWSFWKSNVFFNRPNRKPDYHNNKSLHTYKWVVKQYGLDKENDKRVVFKRLPKRWVKEMEIF